MAEPLLPDPAERDASGPQTPGGAVDDPAASEIRDEIDRSDEASAGDSEARSDERPTGGSDDRIETAGAAEDAPVHLSQSRLTPEELTQDLAEEGADS